MRKTVNLTQHPATAEQLAAGVFDLEGGELEMLKGLLTFHRVPTVAQVQIAAIGIARIAERSEGVYAMIGGAPFLMAELEKAVLKAGLVPRYAFSVRESVESINADGSVTKTAVFKHAGWVDVDLKGHE